MIALFDSPVVACSTIRASGANVLLDQEWVHDSSKTVGQALQEAGAEVVDFQRFSVAQ